MPTTWSWILPKCVDATSFPDAFPYQAATGLTYDSGNYAQGMERALELLDYPHWRARARQQKPDEPLIGIGLATFLKSSGAAGDHRRERRGDHHTLGDIIIYTGISPHGGSETSFAQIVADVLGVHPAQVRVRHSDTALFPLAKAPVPVAVSSWAALPSTP